jgi:hypothetical protein
MEVNTMEIQEKSLSYEDYLNSIDNLNIDEQLDLIDALSTSIKTRIGKKRLKNHSILELKGLGVEIWKGIDAQKYVSKERESWD